MKRVLDASSATHTKRRRVSGSSNYNHPDAVFSDPTLERCTDDILRDGVTGDGYLAGTVAMRWPLQNGKMHLELKTSSGSKVCITLTGQCSRHFDQLACNIRDVVKISLQGALLADAKSAAASITYGQGVILLFENTRDNARDGQIVNTWTLDKPAAPESGHPPSTLVNDDDWYSTPSERHRVISKPVITPVDACRPSSIVKTVNPVSVLQYEAVPSRLSDSMSTFSPSLQLAATQPRKSTSATAAAQACSTAGEIGVHSGRDQSDNSFSNAESRLPTVLQSGTTPRPLTSKQTDGASSNLGPAQPAVRAPDELVNNVPNGPGRPVASRIVMPAGDLSAHGKLSKKQEKKLLRKQKKQTREAISVQRQEDRASQAEIPAVVLATRQDDESTNRMDTTRSGQTSPLGRHETPVTDKLHPAPSASISRRSIASTPPSNSSDTRRLSPSHAPPSVKNTTPPAQSVPSSGHSTPSVAGSSTLTLKAESSDDFSSLRAGFKSGDNYYTPLVRIEEKNKTYNIIAVVVSTGFIGDTATGERKIALSLTDPSIHDSGTFALNCFAKQAVSLPEPQVGDVLILRYMLGDTYSGRKCGTAPSYRSWAWAIVDPKRQESVRARGEMSFEPRASELRHCARLSEWWVSVGTSVDLGVVQQINPSRSGRIHRLISEATPYCEPSGYFDCTVEVLFGHANSNGVYSLYVTDYTHNPAIVHIERDWCPPLLNDKILKIELFLDAAKKGPDVRAGEYYFIGNCRMKMSSGGYLEATFSETNKMRKLSEDELETEPRLVALMQRKMEWHAKIEASGGTHEFPHLLFENAEENKHFRCTVEVLFISSKDQYTYLYVTDYTPRTDLAPVAFTVPSALELDKCVVKISLHDGQAEIAKQLEQGDLVAIRNLRLRPSGYENKLTGRLGGNQRLISKLQANSQNNPELKELLTRKEEFEIQKQKRNAARTAKADRKHNWSGADRHAKRVLEQPDMSRRASASSAMTVNAPTVPGCPASFTSIEEVEADKVCPNKFRLRARIVDFYPSDIRQFTTRRCTKCMDVISEVQRVCPGCDDVMDPDNKSSVRAFWQFALEVQDERGNQLQIYQCDDQCSILKDLEAEDVEEEDDAAVEELTQRLKSLLGNLLEVHDCASRRRMQAVEPDSPWLSLVLGSYMSESEGSTLAKEYVLLECSPAAS